tara:strand:- start:35 stop:208 length:174 start_codon:yes stop_codon:yes gene_type:complete
MDTLLVVAVVMITHHLLVVLVDLVVVRLVNQQPWDQAMGPLIPVVVEQEMEMVGLVL